MLVNLAADALFGVECVSGLYVALQSITYIFFGQFNLLVLMRLVVRSAFLM